MVDDHSSQWHVEVFFVQPDGDEERCASKPGDTLMDVALDNGVRGIHAQCGGGCTCCTCHCYVDPPWYQLLGKKHPDELEMLTYAWHPEATSRLACQVMLTPQLDGIRVRVPAQQS